ncbi:MAG: DNA mismatch repair endonuclease MutL, partial [Candidatus Margulisbacteria bacterium]|nr:DNA mismatch repair endonuclease MutL [Candidatus Margulisiibacteriota bacterium]
GEVVERPASVVKELVENSIDAGATKITVEVQDAGRRLIRVSDNGLGMNKEEILLAVQRHSTSKISKLDDLFNIQTLGFRGEALPSIASVSRLSIEPNPSGSGITVKAKDLFYNVPVRKKFLKSPATEMGHIGDIVSRYAMANPHVAFELISDGKPFLLTSGSGDLKEAVAAVYGLELVKALLPVESAGIKGLISRPTLSRINKDYEVFYVNQRYIKNFLLNRALEEAYRTLIPGNRYPVAVLFIEIDPKQIDVNVHPTKREIKFSKTQEVMDSVTQAVREALAKTIEAGSWDKGNDAGMEAGGRKWGFDSVDQLPMTNTSSFEGVELQVTAVQPLIPLYQLRATYIICTDGEELALIDQHAAHERILYDRLSQQVAGADSQALLIPETIELSPAESIVLKAQLDFLNSLGFELEVFGSNSYLLRSVPAVSAKAVAKQLIRDIIADLQSEGKGVPAEEKKENIRKLIACHSAIKAGDKLTEQEMNQLIRDLYSTPSPFTCPHGRPTLIRISGEELAKRFGR